MNAMPDKATTTRTCILCDEVMPEYWQKLDDDSAMSLQRAFGIRPVCPKCMTEKLLGRFGGRRQDHGA